MVFIHCLVYEQNNGRSGRINDLLNDNPLKII